MYEVYVYILDTLADWELGYVTSELHSGRFFKPGAPCVSVQTVGLSKAPIQTMGGLTVVPDRVLEEIAVAQTSVLILPGANTWNDPRHGAVIEKARALLAVGATVAAICGATVALANGGLLDRRAHTSNGPGFLEMTAPAYQGQGFYVDEPSVAAGNLITAAATGALLWAKQLIGRLGVFRDNTLAAWYSYFSTGKAEYFYTLMQTLETPERGEGGAPM